MNKAQLIQQVVTATGAHRLNVTTIIESALSTMSETLAFGQDVNLVGFGAFRVKSRDERIGRNPKTGESVNVPPRKSLRFAPSVTLAKKVKLA